MARWKIWWKDLQPTWCNMEAWPPTRTSSTEENNWTVLSQGGCNRLYLVIILLSWWLMTAAKAGDETSAAWQEAMVAVADIEWVLNQILIQ
ncbi:hypothetical protein QCA50_018897, partial [Cerrena zonata]